MSRSLRSNKKGPFSSSNDDVDTFYPTTSSNNTTRQTRRKSKIEVQESVPAPVVVSKPKTRTRSRTREMNTVDVDTNDREEIIPPQSNSTSSSSSIFTNGSKYQKHDLQQSSDNFDHLSLLDNTDKEEETTTPLPSDDIKPVSFYSLLSKNVSLLLGLTLFGTGTLILFTQIENNSPLKLFLQSSFLSFQKSESYKIHLQQLEIFQQLSSVQDHHYSFAVGALGLLFILTGGYFYFNSKKAELQRQMDVEREKKIIKNNLIRSITKSATTAMPPVSHSNIANTAANIFNIATAASVDGTTTSIISDNTAIFLQQIEIYKQQLKEQSLHFNLMAFLERMKVKWFRIVCILVIMLIFYGIKILYINRESVILYIQSGGVLITKIFFALIILILFVNSIVYCFRARRRHYKLISFFANVIKNRLAIYNGAEYPIDFMEEDVRDFVTSYNQQRQQDERRLKTNSIDNVTLGSSDSFSTNSNTITSTDNNNTNTAHNHASFLLSSTARLTSWDGFSPTPAAHSSSSLSQSHASTNKSINPVNIQSSTSLIPEGIAVRLKPCMVKKYWKQIQNEVNKDKRVQVVTVLYHGMNRKCWRRLDLIPRLSTAQKHSSSTSNITGVNATRNYTSNMKTNPNINTSNIASRLTSLNSINPNTNTPNNTTATSRQTSITNNDNADDEVDPYDHDWTQSIVGRQSTTTGTPYVKGTAATTSASSSSTSKYSNVARTGF